MGSRLYARRMNGEEVKDIVIFTSIILGNIIFLVLFTILLFQACRSIFNHFENKDEEKKLARKRAQQGKAAPIAADPLTEKDSYHNRTGRADHLEVEINGQLQRTNSATTATTDKTLVAASFKEDHRQVPTDLV